MIGVRHHRAEQLLLHPARRLGRAQRRHADDELDLLVEAMLGEPRHVTAGDACIHAELRLRKLRAGCDLRGQSLGLPSRRRIDRAVGGAEEKLGLPADFLAARQLASVTQLARGLEQLPRVEIEHRLCVRLVAGRRIVAAQHQHVAHAKRRGAHQLALQADAIAVAAGELKDRLDPLFHQNAGRCHRAKMRPRACAIGNVHRIGEAFQRQRLVEQLVARKRNRRRDLGRQNELLGGELLRKRHGHGGQCMQCRQRHKQKSRYTVNRPRKKRPHFVCRNWLQRSRI